MIARSASAPWPISRRLGEPTRPVSPVEYGGKRVVDAEDVVSVGQKVQVEITKIDDRGKLSLAPVVEGGDDE